VAIETADVDLEKNLSHGTGAKGGEVAEPEPYDEFLVDWNGDDDPEKPINWSKGKKTITAVQIMFYTFCTYGGSSIYTPGQPEIQEEFHVGHVPATLALSLFILGYSLGPLIFSPLSEVSTIGRNHIYMATLFLFWILQVGIALTPTFAGLLTLRLLTGFFSSPSIATGGASFGDFVSQDVLPLFIGLWAVGGFMAPSLAPLLGAAMVVAKNWRWTFWLLMWIAAAVWLFMVFFFSETQANNVLHRRAVRVRRETGDNRYYTKHEREDAKIEWGPYVKELVFRPLIIIAAEPGVLAIDVYLALIYGTYYLFFEAFPIVYTEIYTFGPLLLGLSYIGIAIGCILGYVVFVVFLVTQIVPRFKNGTFTLERFLYLCVWVCFLIPISLFIFGWSAAKHWELPIFCEIVYAIAAFNIFQSLFAYLSLNYPRYLASVFAGNALIRSAFAVAFPLFGQAMYDNLATPNFPVGWGCSLLGFVSFAMAFIPFGLIKLGPKLRGRSHYAN
jgi:MFS transporter, DHA1 family, multidrug resistance protein